MKIESLSVKAEGYAFCKSQFYSVEDIVSDSYCEFKRGLTVLKGGIDSGNWALSYLLSMYKYKKNDFYLNPILEICVNHKATTLDEVLSNSCYIDESYPLFSSKKTVETLVATGIAKSKQDLSTERVKEIFGLDCERFKRAVSCNGNEKYRAMVAIAYAYGKQIYCFPWFSRMRYAGLKNNIEPIFNIANELGIVILPTEGIT